MIEYEKFIYLDVYKTGSTYVADLLKRLVKEEPVRSVRHAPLTRGRPFFWKQGKPAFATVRNPWDWYVSMWSYSIVQKNVLFFRDVRKAVGPENASLLFDSSRPRESFSLWMKSINDVDFLQQVMTGHPYPRSGLSGFLGFYSYRFMRVTTPHPSIFLRQWNISSVDRAIAHQKRWAIYDTVLKSEGLKDSFAKYVLDHRKQCNFVSNAETILENRGAKAKNTSERTLPSYRDYYTDELRDMVANRDRLFIDLFGYEF